MSKKMRTTVGISVFAFILAIAAIAFAQGPYGGGPGMRGGGYGCEYGQRGYGGQADLSDETRARIDDARETFFNETRELRDSIQEARIALRDEMTQDSPDEAEVIRLQKALSALEAQFDEKAVSHRLAMRKLMPEEFRGRGYARGYGGGKRGGGRGPGGCWK